jgi:DNA-binding NarL/FixJ family response regulator
VSLRLVVCDDHAPTRGSYVTLLAAEPDLEVVAEAANGVEAVDAVRRFAPDVLVMDVRMPVMDGIAATRAVQLLEDPPKVVILTTFDLDDYVLSALRAGASGFLVKDSPPGALVEAVRVVAAGDALLSPSVTRRLLDSFAGRQLRTHAEAAQTLAALSPREADVLRLVGTGLSNTEIAHRLFIEESTVKTYVSRLLTKLGARNRVALAILVHEQGLT